MVHSQGHFGILRTNLSVQARFYWPFWQSDVARFVRNCIPCVQRKGPRRKQYPPSKQYLCSEPLQRIAMDIIGPLILTEKGNKYALVICDYFTKWVEIVAIPKTDAKVVADAIILHFVSKFGLPQRLHSDQGQNFESKLIAALCERLHIEKTRATAYNPRSDGLVEK